MKVIITGSTGMVGKGVLLECLESSQIDKVLLVNRSPIDIEHPKLEEILLDNFLDISSVKDKLTGLDACFYCMGVSALGMTEEDYTKITFDTTKAFVDVLFASNPNLVFNYVSGMGTDSSEKGKQMWARVKGRTENMVLNKGFKDAYAFRPGVILPEKGIKSKTAWYNASYVLLRPFFGLLKRSKNVTTTTNVGKAMLATLRHPNPKKHLENPDINQLSLQ